MRVLLLVLLVALNAALTLGAEEERAHRAKRGVADYITGLIYRASDIVFRSFAEASGYKVTRLPPKASEKSYTEQHHHSDGKTAGKSYTKEKKTHYATTTERVVTHGESYSSKSGPHKSEFNFYLEDGHSDFDNWASKKPVHSSDHDGGGGDEEEDKPEFKVWVTQEEESKVVKKKRPSRIKIHRKGEEETVRVNKFSKEGPKISHGASTEHKQPLIIKVLQPTPSRSPESSLEDSWPSVWRGAH